MHTIRTLLPVEFAKYRDHLLNLDPFARRLRFEHAVSNPVIERFVAEMDPTENRVLAVFDDRLRVIGAVQIALLRGKAAELAFSVDRAWRDRGVGRALFERAILWAKNRGLRRLYLHCLVENQNMTHLSRALGLTVSNECGENQGVLELEPATPMAVLRELTEEAAAVCDYTLKATRAFQSLSMIQYAA